MRATKKSERHTHAGTRAARFSPRQPPTERSFPGRTFAGSGVKPRPKRNSHGRNRPGPKSPREIWLSTRSLLFFRAVTPPPPLPLSCYLPSSGTGREEREGETFLEGLYSLPLFLPAHFPFRARRVISVALIPKRRQENK